MIQPVVPVEPPTGALYLYGVVPADAEPAGEWTPVEGVRGIADKAVFLLTQGKIAAVVSAAPSGRIRPERRHLAAHQGVLKTIGASRDVLPMAFGIIAGSRKEAARVLRESGGALREQIDRVRGRVEMTVRLSLSGASIFEDVVAQDPELREARDRMVRAGSPHDMKMDVGRQFEQALSRKREAAEAAFREQVAALVVEQKDGARRSEAELFNASFLVDRARVAEFEAGVERAAAQFDDRHVVDLSGPWPPHSFVEARLDLRGAA